MAIALLAFVLSAAAGICLSFFNYGFGAAASVSATGGFAVYYLKKIADK